MTDDDTPTAIPAAIATGSEKACGGAREPDRGDEEEGEQHCRRQPVDPAQARAPCDAVGEDDVGGEQRGVREGEGHPDRLPLELHVRQQVHAYGRCRDRGDVASRPRTDRREDDRADELDRGNRRQREPVDRDVEADVHRGEDGPQRNDQRPSAAIEREKRAPGPPPEGEDRRGRGDPEPCDAEHVHPGEEQDREGGPEIVEDGAADEVRLGRHRIGAEPRLSGLNGDGYKSCRASLKFAMGNRRC